MNNMFSLIFNKLSTKNHVKFKIKGNFCKSISDKMSDCVKID